MKKALIYIFAASLALASCRKDEIQVTTIKEVDDIAVQNSNDDKAILKYMDEHYLDEKGKIQAIGTSTTQTKLSALNPKILPSGVVVIIRPGAQPDPGTAIGTTDVIRLMGKNTAFLSTVTDNVVTYTGEKEFFSTVESTGVPLVDPQFYYVTDDVVKQSGFAKSYFEIEGFQEGLKYFQSFNKADSENYNMQGVILVPSRAAFARDSHFPYGGFSYRNNNFVFNFQVYKATPRK